MWWGCGAHRGSGRPRGAFAVLGAGAGFGHGRAVRLLPLDGDEEDAEDRKKKRLSLSQEAAETGSVGLSSLQINVLTKVTLVEEVKCCREIDPRSYQKGSEYIVRLEDSFRRTSAAELWFSGSMNYMYLSEALEPRRTSLRSSTLYNLRYSS